MLSKKFRNFLFFGAIAALFAAVGYWNISPERIQNGRPVAEGFSYTSDNNTEWMQPGELQAWIDANRAKIGSI